MKVGTDGVLLGAWCRVGPEQRRLLDVGAGTGVIALMLAQRLDEAKSERSAGLAAALSVQEPPSGTILQKQDDPVRSVGTDAGTEDGSCLYEPVHVAEPGGFRIDALEIDPESCAQTERNVAESPWPERVRVVCGSLQEFAGYAENRGRYDHIVSNPPYFVDSLLSPDPARSAARHTASLTFAELAEGVRELLAPDGIFSVILPPVEARELLAEAIQQGFFLHRRTEVFSKPGTLPKRVLMEFGRNAGERQDASLLISDGDPTGYSAEYRALTRDFYLKF